MNSSVMQHFGSNKLTFSLTVFEMRSRTHFDTWRLASCSTY